MARDEQLLISDQDNALVLDDRFDPPRMTHISVALHRLCAMASPRVGTATVRAASWRRTINGASL